MENKQSIAEVCRNPGVFRGAMERWLAVLADNHDGEKVRLRQMEEENRQLRKEKADLEDTVEILKKQRPSSVKARENVQDNPRTQRGAFCGEDVITNLRHNYPVAPNLLNQDFHVDVPNKVWMTDITYIRMSEGWLYLAAVKDLFDRRSSALLLAAELIPTFASVR